MFKLTKTSIAIALVAATTMGTAMAAKYGYGRAPTQDEIDMMDIDVRPDGEGYPEGSGSVLEGEPLYIQQCAYCHGEFGESAGRWPVLAGGEGTLADERPEKTIGSYWPYASTIFDYVHRAMPFPAPQSLSDDETYAITAYLLYLNDLVDEDFVASKETLTGFKMPNEDGFFMDDRPDSPNTRCMENCRDPESIEITWDSTELGVTPIDHLTDDADEAPTEAAAEPSIDGAALYKQACAACHDMGVAGAPANGDAAQWADRIAQGSEVLYDHAINGYQGSAGYMPPKGGRADLSDEEVQAIVDYMVESSQ
ncbi:MAG: c-type cytochrome [Gammaproteobacteria bacterium]|nr:c-type cytochrome [Gammaproteobacteria bacterium]